MKMLGPAQSSCFVLKICIFLSKTEGRRKSRQYSFKIGTYRDDSVVKNTYFMLLQGPGFSSQNSHCSQQPTALVPRNPMPSSDF